MRKEFKAKLVGRGPGGAWTFLPIPFNVEKVFGRRARVPVKGTINGFPFRNSLMPEGNGTHSMMVNKGLQKGAGVSAGDTVKVVMEIDTVPRTVPVPVDLKKAFKKNPHVKAAFDRLSYSHKKEYIDWLAEAKKPETRQRRLAKSLQLLRTGKKLKG